MKNFLITVQFLTRIPIPLSLEVTETNFRKGVVYFPLVGLIIGFCNALVYYFSLQVFHSNHLIAAFLATFSNVIVTGGIHLDGLADTCDGIFSGRSLERILEIMKDSQMGTFGTIAIVFSLLFRIFFLYSLPMQTAILVLLLMPMLSRTSLLFLMYKAKYARQEGLGNLFIGKVSFYRMLITVSSGLILAFILFKIEGILLALGSFLLAYLFRRNISKKLGGLTGDILGAGEELLEIACLIIFVILKG